MAFVHQSRGADKKYQLHAREIETIRRTYAQISPFVRNRVANALAGVQQVQLAQRKRALLEHLDQRLTYQADRSDNRNTDTCRHRHLHALRTGTVAKWQITATSAAERRIE
jgi:hypothetical protein